MLVVLSLLILGLGDVSCHNDHTMTSQNCSSVVEMILESAYSGVGWGVEMVDASAKPPIGILRQILLLPSPVPVVPPDSFLFLGNYDQCLSVDTSKDFATSYCRADLQVKKVGLKTLSTPRRVFADICVPDICSGKDLVPVLQHYAKKFPHVDVDVSDVTCLETQFPFTYKAIFVICVLSVLLFLVTVGTIYDIVYMQDVLAVFKEEATSTSSGTEMSRKIVDDSSVEQDAGRTKSIESDKIPKETEPHSFKPGNIGQVLVSFSLYTNIPNMLSTSQSKGSITCINGIRVLFTTWIVSGHVFFLIMALLDNSSDYQKQSAKNWSFQPILLFTLAVDAFFLMSGLLSAHKTMKELQRERPSLQYFKRFYLHRYWRLTPPLLLSAMTYVALFKYISDGPLWPQGEIEINECEHNWWRMPLYILGAAEDTCFGHTWSLFLDMQYYIISPVVLLALFYFNCYGLWVPIGMIAASSLYVGSMVWKYELPPNLEFDEKFSTYVNVYYMSALARMGPYFVGMVTGYLLYKTDCKVKLSKWFVTVGWVVSITVLFGIFAALYGYHNGDTVSVGMSSVYTALHRNLFVAAIGWVIFACSCGYGGVVNRILSWNFFTPLARLSYLTYLLHPAVITYFVRSQRRLFYTNAINVTFLNAGCLLISTVVAGIAYLFFEAPFANLERVIRNIWKGEKTVKVHQN